MTSSRWPAPPTERRSSLRHKRAPGVSKVRAPPHWLLAVHLHCPCQISAVAAVNLTGQLLCCADAGLRQPLAPTWLFPAQNKRANNQNKVQSQALKPPLQPPTHVGLLEQLAFTVVAAEKADPASPAEHHAVAQHDAAALPQTAPVAAQPQQSWERMPSASLEDAMEGMDARRGGDATDEPELPAAEASTGRVHLEGEAPELQEHNSSGGHEHLEGEAPEEREHNSRGGHEHLGEEAPRVQEHNSGGPPDEVPAQIGAAAENGSVPCIMSGEETRVMPEPPEPLSSTGHEHADAAQRDPYEFDPDMDAARDGSVRLQQRFAAVSSQRDRAAGPKPLRPHTAAVAQEDVSASQGNSASMDADAGHAFAQVANLVQQMSSEASPSEHSRGVEAACAQRGTDRQDASCQQPRSQVQDAQGHASGVALRSRHCAQPHPVEKRQQQPKKRRRKEDAATAACWTAPAKAAPDTVDMSRRSRRMAADEARAARPGTRSSKHPLVKPSPPPPRGAKRGGAQPQHAAPKPKRSAQQRQRSPEPAPRTEAEAAAPECTTADTLRRPQRERRSSSKYGTDYISSLPPCILNGAAAAADPSPGRRGLQCSMHPTQEPQAGSLADWSLRADIQAVAGPLSACPVRSNSSLRHQAATEGADIWELIVSADTPPGTSDACGPCTLEAVQEEPEGLPCSADAPVLKQPAAAPCSQPQMPPEYLLKRSARVAQKVLGVTLSPEFKSLPSPSRPLLRKAHTTPSTAPAGCAPKPAAAAELKTPAAFRAQQWAAATERVIQAKRAAPGSIGPRAAKRGASMSSWRTDRDEAEQSGGDESVATGETPSAALQGPRRSGLRSGGQKKDEQLHKQPLKPGKHGTGQGNSANAEQVPGSAAPYQMRKVRTPSCKLQEW